MRRLLKIVLVLAVLAAIGLLALWQVLRGGHARAEVEARLTATLGQPVSIGRLGVTLFPRLAISGGDVRLGEARVEAPALAVDRILIVPRLGPLLTGSVIVEQIHLDGFTIGVLRDDKGQWHVPSVVPAPTAGEGGGAVVERVRITSGRVRVFDGALGGEIRETAAIHDLDADVTVEAGTLRFAPITGRIGSAEISGEARAGARVIHLDFTADRVTDDDLPVLLGLLGSERPPFLRLPAPAAIAGSIEVERAKSHLSGKGRIQAPEVRFEPVRVEQLDAPFTIDGSDLRFDPAVFRMYGGAHRGSVTIRIGERPSAGAGAGTGWATDSRITGMDAGAFLNALTGGDQRLDGTASVTAALSGRVEEALQQTVNGRVHVVLTDGVIRQFPLLGAVNRVLRLAEQQEGDTRFERLSATFAVAGGQAVTDDLVLVAEHVRVEAAGRIGADRSIALRGRALVSAARSAVAIASVRELSGLRNGAGEIALPLTVSGTLDQPSFGLDLKAAIGKGIRDELERRLRGIIKRRPEP